MDVSSIEQLGLTLAIGSWEELAEPASKVRFEVFVQEQNVPIEEELDAFDALSDHAVVFNVEQQPIATGRLLPDGHIGRMAVCQLGRGQGIGGIVLQALIDLAKKKAFAEVVLSAQTHAIGFYERFGFVVEGDIYMDAGIEHKDMRLVFKN